MNEAEIKDDDDDEKEKVFRAMTKLDDTSRGKLHVFVCVFATSTETSLIKSYEIMIKGNYLSSPTNVAKKISLCFLFFRNFHRNQLEEKMQQIETINQRERDAG